MKLDANWKSHSTPALINLLADMIKLQQLDLQHALYNSGNYRLFGFNKKTCIREDIFRAKTSEDQNKYFVKFLNSKRVITNSKQHLCNINLFRHQQSHWVCEETRAKEATSQCKDIQKTLKEKKSLL